MEAIERKPATVTSLRCASCGDVIGVYESLVHVVEGIAHRTSRAADPQLACTGSGACYHSPCADLTGEVVVVE